MIAAAPRRRVAAPALPRRTAGRLRAIAVAALGIAALLAVSLLSMRVEAERARVAELDRRIAAARRTNAMLATEIDIRTRPGALLVWGETSLALAPPRVRQYLTGLGQLDALARPAPIAMASTGR